MTKEATMAKAKADLAERVARKLVEVRQNGADGFTLVIHTIHVGYYAPDQRELANERRAQIIDSLAAALRKSGLKGK